MPDYVGFFLYSQGLLFSSKIFSISRILYDLTLLLESIDLDSLLEDFKLDFTGD